jgi:drug/metabolite transporter (DMT)-like permease
MGNNKKYYALMTFGTVLWAGAFIAGKLGIGKLSPVLLTYFRMLFATIIIFPILIMKDAKWKIERYQIKYVFWTGLIGMTGYHLFFFTALRYTTASNASIINATNPIITAILAYFILKDSFSKRKIFFIITAFMGVSITILDWNINNLVTLSLNVGDIIMFCGTVCWAGYSIIVKKVMKYFTPLKLTAYTFLSCVVILTPFAMVEIFNTNLSNIGIMPFAAVAYMAVFPTVIGYTIQQIVIRELGPSTTALFINLVPIFSIILAAVVLKESFNYLNLISGGVIIFSVYGFSKK